MRQKGGKERGELGFGRRAGLWFINARDYAFFWFLSSLTKMAFSSLADSENLYSFSFLIF